MTPTPTGPVYTLLANPGPPGSGLGYPWCGPCFTLDGSLLVEANTIDGTSPPYDPYLLRFDPPWAPPRPATSYNAWHYSINTEEVTPERCPRGGYQLVEAQRGLNSSSSLPVGIHTIMRVDMSTSNPDVVLTNSGQGDNQHPVWTQ